MARNRRGIPGRRSTLPFRSRSPIREIDVAVGAAMAKGRISPWWTKGAFVRHIALGYFDPVSLCGRHVGTVTSSPMPAVMGFACPTCVKVWTEALVAHNTKVEDRNEKHITALADELDTLMGSGDAEAIESKWRELNDRPSLRRAVRDRLDERGVDIEGTLGFLSTAGIELPAWGRRN